MRITTGQFGTIWRIPLIVTSAVGTLLLGLFLYSPYGDDFYVFIVAPILCVILFVFLFAAAISREVRALFTVLLTLAGVLAASLVLLKNEEVVRSELRWLFRSQHYKAELLAQPNNGAEFKHLEWDSWGFVPVGNETVYLVYDPSDSLRSSAGRNEPPRVHGIPCNVVLIHRLERQWYSVRFYTDEEWGDCPSARLDGGH